MTQENDNRRTILKLINEHDTALIYETDDTKIGYLRREIKRLKDLLNENSTASSGNSGTNRKRRPTPPSQPSMFAGRDNDLIWLKTQLETGNGLTAITVFNI